MENNKEAIFNFIDDIRFGKINLMTPTLRETIALEFGLTSDKSYEILNEYFTNLKDRKQQLNG